MQPGGRAGRLHLTHITEASTPFTQCSDPRTPYTPGIALVEEPMKAGRLRRLRKTAARPFKAVGQQMRQLRQAFK